MTKDAPQTTRKGFRIEGLTEAEKDKAARHRLERSCDSLEAEVALLRAALRDCGCAKCGAALYASGGRMS